MNLTTPGPEGLHKRLRRGVQLHHQYRKYI
jgi:hypothetical protein